MMLIINCTVKSSLVAKLYQIVENIKKCLVLYTRQAGPGLLLLFLHQICKYCCCTGAVFLGTGVLSAADKKANVVQFLTCRSLCHAKNKHRATNGKNTSKLDIPTVVV